MNHHSRIKRIAALLVLLVLLGFVLDRHGTDPRDRQIWADNVLAAEAFRRSNAPSTATTASSWIYQGPAPALNGQQNLANILRANSPVAGSLGGAPYSGGHNQIVASPTDPNTIYVGADGGIWKTTNALNASPTWTPLIDDKPSLVINGLSADPTDATFQTLLAGTDRAGLYYTTNGGASWTQIINTTLVPIGYSGGYRAMAARGNTLLVTNSSGLFRTTGGPGGTWTRISGAGGSGLPLGAADGLVGDPANPNRLYVMLKGAAGGIFRSDDTGATWTNVSSGINIISGATSYFDAAVFNNGTINVVTATLNGTENGANTKGLFRSVNGGAFTRLDTPTGSPTFLTADRTNPDLIYTSGYASNVSRVDASQPSGSQVTLLAGQGSTTLSAAATSTATTITVASTSGMPATLPFVVTVDNEQMSVTAITVKTLTVVRGVNGTTPAAHSNGAIVGGYNYGDPHTDYVAFTFDANGSLVAGSHGGIYRLSAPAGPASMTNYWVSIMGDIGAFQFDSIAYDHLSNAILGGSQDNGNAHQTAPGSSTWAKASNGDGDGGDVLVDNVNYAGSTQSARYQSSQNLGGFARRIYNASGSLVSTTSINTSMIIKKRFFSPLAHNPIDPKRFVIGATDGMYESLDQFGTLVNIANFSVGSQNIAYGGYKDGIANADVLYFTKDKAVYARTSALGGVTQVASPPAGSGNIRALVMDPSDWMKVFIVDDRSQVYMTTNGGSSWSSITGDLKTTAGSFGSGRMITIVPGPAGYLAVGTDAGIFASPLSSLGTWWRLGNDLPIVRVSDVVYDATDDVLVIGTYARGAYLMQNASKEFNQAPTVALSGPATIDEGTTASYSFTVSDSNVGDTFTVDSLTVSTGGSLVPGSLITTTLGGSFQVSYPDGPASPSISLVVKDSYADPSDTATVPVTVNNLAPTAAILGAPTSGAVGTPINLGSAVTDPGAADTSAGFTLAWSVTSNGSPFASGSGAGFSFTPNAAATYVVTLNATDQDGVTGSDTATIVTGASNLTENNFSVTVDEGQTATNSGTYSNLNGNSLAFTASVGTLTRNEQTIFVDTFDAEPASGNPRTTLINWNVTAGNVDVIGAGIYDLYPGNGRYLDLGGSTNGTIRSKTTFTLTPGVYQLSFELASNTDGPTDNILRATLGLVFDESFPATTTMTPVVRQFTVSSAVSAQLVFAETGSNNAFGSILDDVKLVRLNAPFDQPNSLNVLGYWQLGEDDAGAADGLAGNSTTLGRDANGLNPALDLTRNGSSTYTSSVAPNSGSVLGMSFNSPTSNSYTRNSPVTTATDNFGIEAWMKFAGPADVTIAANGDGSSGGFGLRVRSDGTYEGRYDGVRFINSGVPVAFGQWRHVALVRDNGVTQIYVGGVQVYSDSLAGPNPAVGGFGIGFSAAGSVQVDDVRIFTFAPGMFNPQDLLYNTPSSGAWSWSYTTDDGPAQSQDVTLTASTGVSGETNSLPFRLVVNNVAPTASLSNGGAVSEDNAGSVSFSGQSDPSTADTTAGFHYAYDFDNDGSFEIGDGTYAGSGTAATAPVPAGFLDDGPGTLTVRGRIIDKDDGFTDYTTPITINNAAPVVSPSGPADALAGQLVTFVFRATDSSPVDQAAGFTYSINWGDGSPVETLNQGKGTGDATARHAYAATGSYTVQVTAADKDGGVSAPASAAITVAELNTTNLQAVIATTPIVYLLAPNTTAAQAMVTTINSLTSPTTPVAITIVLNAGTFQGFTAAPKARITLALAGKDGTVIQGASPALTVTEGEVFAQGLTFTNDTDAPTILVTGGHLTIAQNNIQESTSANNAAVKLTGGNVTLGFENVINVNGQGSFFQTYDPHAIFFSDEIDADLTPNIYQVDGNTLLAFQQSATDLSSSANPSTFGQAVTFTATVDVEAEEHGSATGTVTFYEGATVLGTGTLSPAGGDLFTASFSTSALSVGTHTIIAVYEGNDTYVASSAQLTQQVGTFPFSGFFQPVDNPPTLNEVNAGQSIPVKFSLGGDRGLGIIASGYPTSQQITCPGSAPVDDVEETTNSNEGLTYENGQYKYVWKTTGSWDGTCRQFTLRLTDGTEHTALFTFR